MYPSRTAASILMLSAALSACSETTHRPPLALPMYVQAQAQADALNVTPVDDSANQPQTYPVQPAPEVQSGPVWTPVSDGLAPIDTSQQSYVAAMAATDPSDRVDQLELAAANGSGPAHYELAKVYTEGKIRPRDLELAQRHLQAAASLNDPEATRVLGWQMIRGDNGEKNLAGGAAIMEMGVAKSVRAQRELGMLYANLYDEYKLNDPERGEQLLTQAYQAGDTLAAAALGKLYVSQGKDIEAVGPLSFASDHKDAQATKMLRSMTGGAGDVIQPGPQAAEPSNGESYYLQANEIMLRRHSATEEAKAYALFSIASDQGYNLANTELRAISGVKAQMDAQQGPEWLPQAKQSILASGR